MRILIFIFSFLVLFSSYYAIAQEDKVAFDYSAFSNLPVLHEGRVKPLDSFARAKLNQISGDEYLQGLPAIHWLSQIIFDPASIETKNLFYIRNAQVKEQLGLLEGDIYFTLADLSEGIGRTADLANSLIQRPSSDLTDQQKKFLQVHENVAAIIQMMRSFSMVLPLNVYIPKRYQGGELQDPISFLDLLEFCSKAKADLKDIISKKGDAIGDYNEQEKEVALFSFQLEEVYNSSLRNDVLKILPVKTSDSDIIFLSPWEQFHKDQDAFQTSAYFQAWVMLVEAYRDHDIKNWIKANTVLADIAQEGEIFNPIQFKLERLYNSVKPYKWALGLYAASIVFVLGIMFLNQAYLWRVSVTFLVTAIAFHASGILGRVLILERPPVGTLYESVLFVSLICSVMGLIVGIRSRNIMAIMAGSLAALGLLSLSPVIAPKGEDLEVLVAVLNTSFWLATHVIIITAGYAICILVACFAHFYLLQRLMCQKDSKNTDNLYDLTYKTSIAALLFTAVGTILGGIWADQSWGRFWGWDPKENGALLIVLWLIWVQHGRISGHFDKLLFMAGMAMLNIIVAIAWFGVNLLGVGLHSYGFTSGMLWGLATFCGIEMTVVIVLYLLSKRKVAGI